MTLPAILTLGEAAKALDVTKPTITNRVQKGQLPYGKNEKGHYKIQLADLQRLYPDDWERAQAKRAIDGQENSQTLHQLTPENPAVLEALTNAHQETVKALRETMAEKDNLLDEKNNQISHWKTEASKANNLLEDKRSDAEKAQVQLEAERANKAKTTRRRVTLWDVLKKRDVVETNEAEEVA